MESPPLKATSQTNPFPKIMVQILIYLGFKLIAFIGSVLLGSFICQIAFGSWDFDFDTYTMIAMFGGAYVLVFGVPTSFLLDLLIRWDRKRWFGLKLILHGLAGILILWLPWIGLHDFYNYSLCYSLLFYAIYAGVKLKWGAKASRR